MPKTNLTIGGESNSADGGGHAAIRLPFSGLLNDLRIWDNEIISQKIIKMLSQGLVCHYPLSRNGFGQDNYFSCPDFIRGTSGTANLREYSNGLFTLTANTKNSFYQLVPALNEYTSAKIPAGTYIFSIQNWVSDVSMNDVTGLALKVKNSSDSTFLLRNNIPTTLADECSFVEIVGNNTISKGSTISCRFMLEKGSVATPWIPASTDPLYSAMGLDNNIVYDTSGYQNNGELITPSLVSYSSNTAKYNVSTVFGMQSSSSFSYLNTADFYMPDEFTISYWWYYDSDTKVQSNSASTLAYADTGFGRGYMDYGVHHYDNHFMISLAPEGTDTRTYYGYANYNPTDKAWNFITLTFDGYVFKSYKNGRFVHQYDAGASEKLHIVRHDKILRIGYDQAGGVVRGCAGNLSDFRIYATALSADEIADLYHTSATITSNGTLLTNEVNET